MKYFKLAALGGTFDIIHKGHKRILKEAFTDAEIIIIGLTSDELVKKLRKKHRVSEYNERLRQLKKFLQEEGYEHRAIIVRLEDPYGPTIVKPEIDSIVVSEETLPTAFEINKLRVARNMKPLSIIVIKMVLAEDGKPISTTRIKRGEITPNGKILKGRNIESTWMM